MLTGESQVFAHAPWFLIMRRQGSHVSSKLWGVRCHRLGGIQTRKPTLREMPAYSSHGELRTAGVFRTTDSDSTEPQDRMRHVRFL